MAAPQPPADHVAPPVPPIAQSPERGGPRATAGDPPVHPVWLRAPTGSGPHVLPPPRRGMARVRPQAADGDERVRLDLRSVPSPTHEELTTEPVVARSASEFAEPSVCAGSPDDADVASALSELPAGDPSGQPAIVAAHPVVAALPVVDPPIGERSSDDDVAREGLAPALNEPPARASSDEPSVVAAPPAVQPTVPGASSDPLVALDIAAVHAEPAVHCAPVDELADVETREALVAQAMIVEIGPFMAERLTDSHGSTDAEIEDLTDECVALDSGPVFTDALDLERSDAADVADVVSAPSSERAHAEAPQARTASYAGAAPRTPTRVAMPAAAQADLRLKPALAALEQTYITAAMARTGGNQSAAARLLGLSRFGLQKKLRRLATGEPCED